MHFCQDELIALLALIPGIRLVVLLVRGKVGK